MTEEISDVLIVWPDMTPEVSIDPVVRLRHYEAWAVKLVEAAINKAQVGLMEREQAYARLALLLQSFSRDYRDKLAEFHQGEEPAHEPDEGGGG